MSDLTPSFITLNTGLDLQSPKIAAAPGTALDMLNYEQVDFQGQKRIDGYARYDGSRGSYIDDFLRVNEPGMGEVGSILHSEDGNPFAVVLNSFEEYTDLAIINETKIKELTYSYSWGRDAAQSPEDHYNLVLQYNTILRERTTELPGPVAGLHWFRDRLYAIASVPAVEATGVYPNEQWEGYDVLKVDGEKVYLGTSDIVGTESSDIASFFVSRNEAQALNELGDSVDFGWRFAHQGWLVPFENGVSLYGSLAALNQNRQDVGVQGPSSIQGDSGRPLLLIQNIPTTNTPAQVQGWKTSTFPNVYNLDSGALRDDDGTYIYADMHVKWSEDSNEVVALTDNLVQYTASNTVVVEV